jgi:hypothetical protein
MRALCDKYEEHIRSNPLGVVSVDIAVRMMRDCEKAGFSRGMTAAIEALMPFAKGDLLLSAKLTQMLESLRLLSSEMIADAKAGR